MITTLPSNDYFRIETLRGLPATSKPDRATGLIPGIKALQLGQVNDQRPWKVDRVTLEQFVGLVNGRPNGLKMRFAHPNMSRDGMGRRVGSASKARIVEAGDDTYAAVDGQLSDASKRSPNGNLFDHVMDLALESPEDFGVSAAPVLDREAMGKITPDANGLTPLRFKDLRAVDFVDEPAATRGGLFSIDSDSPSDLAAQATWLLDTHFADATPDVIRGRVGEFLDTFLRSKGTDMTTVDQAAELAAKQKQIDELTTKLAALEKPITPVVTLSKEDAEKEKAKAELSRRSEITALCTLAKIPDVDRDLFLSAGFSRAEAQDYLKSSGRLSQANPPIGEGGVDPAKPKSTEDDKFAKEFDDNSDVFSRQGITKEQYIKSRKLDK